MFSSNTSQVSEDRLYVEDVFSTYLYSGNSTGALTAINNGIDLAGKGGLVWLKQRNNNYGSAGGWTNHFLHDSARGVQEALYSNATNAQTTIANMSSFNSNGFSVRDEYIYQTATTYASWTFRKAPKFFDVVTWTGNGTAGRTIAHNLGVSPGCIIVKRTDTTSNWPVYQRSIGATKLLFLNASQGQGTSNAFWYDTEPTATDFTVGSDATVNASGGTYVAYLFAHDTTSDGIIQCGSFSAGGSVTKDVTLGWEPQWLLIKIASGGPGDWTIIDNMRGIPSSSTDEGSQEARRLAANTSNLEGNGNVAGISATGFQARNLNTSGTYIYIAIRRGPMRTPTTGTSVFSPLALNNAAGTVNTTGFPVDLQMIRGRGSGNPVYFMDRLRGVNSTSSTSVASPYLQSTSTSAESSLSDMTRSFSNTGYTTTSQWASVNSIYWNFKRAPSFMDVVCYTGNGTFGPRNHNLGVVPELLITKQRSATSYWSVWRPNNADGKEGVLNTNAAWTTSFGPGYPRATATTFDPGWDNNGVTVVTYLFASCPGVSKVGSYTGNGSSQTINCGFSGGARFVMIKRTDSTGNWLVGDTARGLVAGNDPLVYMNSDVAEITTLDWLDTDSSGFVVNQDTTSNANVNGATYIYLAVA